MERRFPRTIGSLEAIHAFVDEFATAENIASDGRHDLDLMIEELFTNVVRHARGGGADVAIALDRRGGTLTMTLADFDVEAFDVTRVSTFDPETPLAKRGTGGMGLYLVKRIADEMLYDYHDRTSTITVVKRVEP